MAFNGAHGAGHGPPIDDYRMPLINEDAPSIEAGNDVNIASYRTSFKRLSSFSESLSLRPFVARAKEVRTLKQKFMDKILQAVLPDSVRATPKSAKSAVCDAEARLIDRDAPFQQSFGRMKIRRKNRPYEHFFSDPFHLLVEFSTKKVLLIFWSVYCATFMLFACVFWLASVPCHIGCDTYMEALILTVETMMTIGYGVPDPYFRDCPWLSAFLIVQCLVAVMYDACFVGLVYQRVSRGTTRASTVLFTDKAILRTVDGHIHFMFRVCEMRRTQLLTAHVRCYLFTRPKMCAFPSEDFEDRQPHYYSGIKQEPMRLEQPDDNLGATAMFILPLTVTHRVDLYSPLVGPPCDGSVGYAAMAERVPFAPLQRSSECDTGVRDGFWCRVCGSTFSVHQQLRRHMEYNAAQEVADGVPDAPHAAANALQAADDPPSAEDIRSRLTEHWAAHDIEVLCIVEGIDASTSSNVQARHSYTANDIVWDCDFAPCVSTDGHGVILDFAHFHDLVET